MYKELFVKRIKYEISRKSAWSIPFCSMRTDRRDEADGHFSQSFCKRACGSDGQLFSKMPQDTVICRSLP
jgi:hypothetical protein